MSEAARRRRELLTAAQAGDRAAFDTFFEENQGLIRMVVSRFSGREAEYDDLFQVACMAFVKAVSGFDLSAGVQFSTYAVPVMLGELKRYFRDNGALRVSRTIKEHAAQLMAERERLSAALGREPTVGELSAASGLKPDEVALALGAMTPVLSLSQTAEEGGSPLLELIGEDPTEAMLDKAAVGAALARLPDRQRRLLLLRYYRSRTQQETAKELGISQVQVSRLEKKALAELRRLLEPATRDGI